MTQGIGAAVKGQSILGEEKFAEEPAGCVKGTGDISEIPEMQRHAGHPELKEVLKETNTRPGQTLREKAREAVDGYGYSQRESAAYRGMHYSSISRHRRRERNFYGVTADEQEE